MRIAKEKDSNNQELQSALAKLETLILSFSHELNNPIHSLQGGLI